MSLKSIILLPNTGDKIHITGEPVRADAFIAPSHLHTVAIHTTCFKGIIHIEASLVANPNHGDWFDVIEPILFPRDGNEEADAVGVSFSGNYAWIRARVSREGFIQPNNLLPPAAIYGTVDRILLNH